MKKFLTLILFAALFSFLAVSCKKSDTKDNSLPAVSDTPQKKVIGISIDTLAIERWQRDLDIFMNKVKELGADVIVQNAGNSCEEQIRQLEYLMEKKVDAIVIIPKDAVLISDAVTKIKTKGIPVISYDRLILNCDVDLYLTIDSERVGELMAEGLLNHSGAKKWFCMLGPQEDFNMTLIQQGVNKILKNQDAYIAFTYYTSAWNYDLAYQAMVDLLNSGNFPEAIICGNDAIANSVIKALNIYNSGPHIPICGQDADISSCQYIVQGKQDFTIYKPISKLAEIAAEYAFILANGSHPQIPSSQHKTINNGYAEISGLWLDPILVDSSNIDEVIINSGFHSKASIYAN